jgi:hypothetical protein
MRRRLLLAALVLSSLAAARSASAQAHWNTERGHLTIRNDASVGIGASTPLRGGINFGLTRTDTNGVTYGPGFLLRPAADVFVIDRLSIGGALEFSFASQRVGNVTADVFTFSVMPRVGYSLPLGDKFSFWPQGGIGVGFANRPGGTDAIVPIDISLPFYFHPVNSFFLGLGPGMTFQPVDSRFASSYWTLDFVRFSLGGSVRIF